MRSRDFKPSAILCILNALHDTKSGMLPVFSQWTKQPFYDIRKQQSTQKCEKIFWNPFPINSNPQETNRIVQNWWKSCCHRWKGDNLKKRLTSSFRHFASTSRRERHNTHTFLFLLLCFSSFPKIFSSSREHSRRSSLGTAPNLHCSCQGQEHFAPKTIPQSKP